MTKIAVITDSASDLSAENEARYGIRVLPFRVNVDGKEYISRKDFDNAGFYRLLQESASIPLTSQITPFEFEDLYASYYEQGYTDLVLVLINSEGSATFANAVMARKTFLEEHPEAEGKMNIYPVDGAGYSGGYGYAAVECAKLAQAGKSGAELAAFAEDWAAHYRIYAGLYTLKYAAKSGRIPSAAAFVGDALGLKPIMRICDHRITTGDKVRGEKNIIPFVAKKVNEEMVPGTPYCVIYGDTPEDADKMTEEATRVLGYPPEDVYQIGAAIAANAGPRVTGIVFRAKD